MKFRGDGSAHMREGMAAVMTVVLLGGLALLAAPIGARHALRSSVALTSVSLSPNIVTAGATTTATLRRNNSRSDQTVILRSGNTAIATVANGLLFPAGSSTKTFTVNTVAGSGGCTSISARTGRDAAVKTTVYVAPPGTPASSTVRLTFSPSGNLADTYYRGMSITGTVTLSAPATGRGASVSLSSSDPDLDIPSSLFIRPGDSSVSFPVKEKTYGGVECAVVAATQGVSVSKRLVIILYPEG